MLGSPLPMKFVRSNRRHTLLPVHPFKVSSMFRCSIFYEKYFFVFSLHFSFIFIFESFVSHVIFTDILIWFYVTALNDRSSALKTVTTTKNTLEYYLLFVLILGLRLSFFPRAPQPRDFFFFLLLLCCTNRTLLGLGDLDLFLRPFCGFQAVKTICNFPSNWFCFSSFFVFNLLLFQIISIFFERSNHVILNMKIPWIFHRIIGWASVSHQIALIQSNGVLFISENV